MSSSVLLSAHFMLQKMIYFVYTYRLFFKLFHSLLILNSLKIAGYHTSSPLNFIFLYPPSSCCQVWVFPKFFHFLFSFKFLSYSVPPLSTSLLTFSYSILSTHPRFTSCTLFPTLSILHFVKDYCFVHCFNISIWSCSPCVHHIL